MSTTLLLRKAKKSDIEQVLKIEKESFKASWSKSSFLSELKQDPQIGLFYVAEKDGEIVGYIILHLYEKGVHIINIAVKKNQRRKGIGSMLIKKAEEIAIERNIPLLVLEVRVSNTPAIQLYKKLNFETVHILKDFYGNKEDALLMIKKVKKN